MTAAQTSTSSQRASHATPPTSPKESRAPRDGHTVTARRTRPPRHCRRLAVTAGDEHCVEMACRRPSARAPLVSLRPACVSTHPCARGSRIPRLLRRFPSLGDTGAHCQCRILVSTGRAHAPISPQSRRGRGSSPLPSQRLLQSRRPGPYSRAVAPLSECRTDFGRVHPNSREHPPQGSPAGRAFLAGSREHACGSASQGVRLGGTGASRILACDLGFG